MKKFQSLTSRLRTKITLEKRIESFDEAGGCEIKWLEYKTTYAEIIDANSYDYCIGNQKTHNKSYIITIRFCKEITLDDRIKIENKLLSIKSISNILQKNQLTEILCQDYI